MENWIQKLKEAGAEEWSISCNELRIPTAQEDLIFDFMFLSDTEN